MKDKTQDIDALFAGECDGDLCGAIYHVLHEKEAIMMELNFDDWPASWVNHWSVWKHYWIWKVDGFESLWTVDVEQLVQFQNCLIEIGDQGASEFFAESMQAVGLDRIGTEALAFSDDIHQLADDWDKEAELPWRKIEICLAKHSRSRRLDFLIQQPGDTTARRIWFMSLSVTDRGSRWLAGRWRL